MADCLFKTIIALNFLIKSRLTVWSHRYYIRQMPKPTKSTKAEDRSPIKVVADNRRARHEYEILETVEAGLSLSGTEVKAIRQGKANLQDSFVRIEDNQAWLYRCHISPYDFGNRFNHDPLRKRRLLVHRRQIDKLKAQTLEKGLTLIPLKLYFRGNW